MQALSSGRHLIVSLVTATALRVRLLGESDNLMLQEPGNTARIIAQLLGNLPRGQAGIFPDHFAHFLGLLADMLFALRPFLGI